MLREVSVEITRKCPNNCIHCSSFSGRECREKLPLSKFEEIVDHAAMLGAETICLSGGEPFLHENIIEMVESVHSKGLKCFIYTSGIVFDSSKKAVSIPTTVLSALANKVTKIIFNIEAGTEDIYNKVMGTIGCFGVMKQSIKAAAKIGILVEAHFVPMKINWKEIDSAILLCKQLGVSKISFLRLVPHGRAAENLEKTLLSEEEIASLKNYLKELQGAYGDSIRIGVPLSTEVACHKCEAAVGKLNIRYDGKVFPCEVFKNLPLEKSLGNVAPCSIYDATLSEIYRNSEYLNRVRELSRSFCATSCETCIGQHLIEIERRN